MKTEDAANLLKAMQILDVSDKYDVDKIVGVILTARTNDEQRPGPRERPAQIMIDANHPMFDDVVGILTGSVNAGKVAAEAKVAELGVERTTEAVKTVK